MINKTVILIALLFLVMVAILNSQPDYILLFWGLESDQN